MSLTECIYACMHHLQSYNSSGMNLSGSSFVVGVLFAAAIASTAALRSCDSRLRILLPHLFKHCDCRYSDWSEWEQVPNTIGTDVSGTCESGQAFIETSFYVQVFYWRFMMKRVKKTSLINNNYIINYYNYRPSCSC